MVAGVLALDAKAGRAADVAQVEAGGKVGPAEENVDRPDLGRAGARRTVGGDEDVVIAVTVHVAGRADSVAGVAFGGDTVDGDTVSAIQIGQTELGREGSAAEDDVGAAGIQLAAYGGVGRADDDVAEAVAVQVAGKADGRANPFFFGHAVDAKAVAAVERVEVDSRWEACRAEDNVDCARPRHAAGVAAGCADEQIGQTVAVHVAGADGRAGGGIERRAGQAKAVVAVEIGQLERRRIGDRAEDDGGFARALLAVGRGGGGADEGVIQTVAIHVAGVAKRLAGLIVGVAPGDAYAVGAIQGTEVEVGCDGVWFGRGLPRQDAQQRQQQQGDPGTKARHDGHARA